MDVPCEYIRCVHAMLDWSFAWLSRAGCLAWCSHLDSFSWLHWSLHAGNQIHQDAPDWIKLSGIDERVHADVKEGNEPCYLVVWGWGWYWVVGNTYSSACRWERRMHWPGSLSWWRWSESDMVTLTCRVQVVTCRHCRNRTDHPHEYRATSWWRHYLYTRIYHYYHTTGISGIT